MVRIAALLWLVSGPAKGPVSDPEARRSFAEAQAAFERGDYEAAADRIEEAYLIEPNPTLLYPWAQAERAGGNCEAAIDLYRRVIESDPGDKLREASEQNIARCEEELAAATVEPTPAEPEPEPEPEANTAAATPPPGPVDDKPRSTAWLRDPVGGALVGVGLAGVIAGGGLMGGAAAKAKRTGDADLHSEYLDDRNAARRLHIAGIVTTSVGGALLLGGVVRYVLVARKPKSTAVRIAPSWSGVTVSGRF